jgi:hypothetical protein
MILRINGIPIEDAREGQFFLTKRIPIMNSLGDSSSVTPRYFLSEEPSYDMMNKMVFRGSIYTNSEEQYIIIAAEAIEISKNMDGRYQCRRFPGKDLLLKQELVDISDKAMGYDPSVFMDPDIVRLALSESIGGSRGQIAGGDRAQTGPSPASLFGKAPSPSELLTSEYRSRVAAQEQDSPLIKACKADIISQENNNESVSDTSKTEASPSSPL